MRKGEPSHELARSGPQRLVALTRIHSILDQEDLRMAGRAALFGGLTKKGLDQELDNISETIAKIAEKYG